MVPAPGNIVNVRQRQYLVESVTPPASPHEEHTLVRMVCLDDDAQGRPLSVLWERELGATVTRPAETGLGRPEKLDPPRHFAAYLHALKWSSVTATDARLFQAPFRAGIHLYDHQLAPLKKALALPRVNLFIADDVGLGKTIEAGLVMQELMLRQRAEYVLVVCPASVTLQWRDEMEKRFGLHFELFTRDFVARRRQERGFGVNPWKTHNRFIVSYQTLRRSENYEPLKAFLEERGRHRTLLVLDEAHVVAPASASRWAVDTETTSRVRQLTENAFEHRLFLSATPHNGHSNSFSALLEMLDPQRFTRGTRVREQQLAPVMVRRLKGDLRQVSAQRHYPERKVVAVELSHEDGVWSATWPGGVRQTLGKGTLAELTLSEQLREYTALAAPDDKRGRLVFINLQKRLLSSVAAFHRTLSVHAARIGAGQVLAARDDDGYTPTEAEGETDAQLEAELEARIAEASEGLDPDVKARKLLEDMLLAADRARAVPDAKVRALLQWIREHQSPLGRGAKWSNTRVIVFTEYGDTLRYLKEQLTSAFEGTDRGEERVMTLHGGLRDESREEVQRAFNGDPAEHPVRVLLCTDAAREGLNLQGRCADLFHFDVPWNPSRLEQRNGRIDRALQPEPEVRCGYFLYTQRAEDAVLDTLARKVDTIQRELGSLGSVLMEKMESALEKGIDPGALARLEAASKAERTEVVRQELESQRELDALRAELSELAEVKEQSRKVLEFDTALLRDALDVGFELSGAGRLEATTGKDGDRSVEAWRLPELPQAWSRTLDSVRFPKQRDETWWQWRERPLKPIVFNAPERVSTELAHLHLSHPVVQRVLQRYLAQGFSASDLSRVTVVRTKRDSVARVVVFGRLSLFGAGAARLHDQLVSVAAKWIEGGGKGHLKPFAEAADKKAIDLLETTLAEAPGLDATPQAVQKKLLAAAPGDFTALWPAVKAEAERQEQEARAKLSERGKVEAKVLEGILKAQREAITEALGTQLELELLGNSQSEKDQLEQWRRDKAHMVARQAALEKELAEQPDQLARFYDVQLSRLSPVGLVYLWPVTR